MPRRPDPLPPALGDSAFRLADALAEGVTSRLRNGFVTPTNGIRVPDTVTEVPLLHRLRLYQAELPDDVAFSHATAAAAWDLPLPYGIDGGSPMHVTRPSDAPPTQRRGTRSHRGLERRTVTEHEGLRLVTPIDTWLDLCATWSRARLVAAGDVLLSHPEGGGLSAIRDRISERRRIVGVRRAEELAPLLRAGSASPKESEARLLFHDERLPEPLLNVDVFDDWGGWLARPDFTWREQKVVGEYDGDQHRTDRSAWQYERERRARLEEAGWTYVEMTNLTLGDPAHRRRLVRRLRDLLI